MKRIVLVLSALVAFPILAQTPVPNPADVGHTTDQFGPEKCPAIGDADTHDSDPYLNALKNRDKPPKESDYVTRTVAQILADKPAGAIKESPKFRSKWTANERKPVEAKETEAIQVVGYLAGAPSHEKPESCNCHDPTHRDYHMWLAGKPGDKQAQSMVVEISPRLLDAHPDWPTLARKAWNDGTKVRVRGWRTWDEEHPPQLKAHVDKKGKKHAATRGTLWEIHPVHEIDVQDENGDWVPIDAH